MAEADPKTTFNVHDAKTHLSRLIDRAHAGEEIVLAKAGAPWAKLVPIAPPPQARRRPGGLTVNEPIDPTTFHVPLDEVDLAFIDDRPAAERR